VKFAHVTTVATQLRSEVPKLGLRLKVVTSSRIAVLNEPSIMLAASQCGSSSERGDWNTRKRKTIHSQSREVSFYYGQAPGHCLYWTSQLRSPTIL
jgi:hypothetical protein